MPWGVYQEYLSARAQGTFRAGPRKWKGVENRLHRKLYQSFGLANQVKQKRYQGIYNDFVI